MTSSRPVLLQLTQTTSRPPARVLDDLATLRLEDAVVVERGTTYLVFAPPRGRGYRLGHAAALSAALVLAVLAATAWWVVAVALLPAAVLPWVPLLLRQPPMLGLGVVEEDSGVTRLTVHGLAWGSLAPALESYLRHLPPPAEEDAKAKSVGVGHSQEYAAVADR